MANEPCQFDDVDAWRSHAYMDTQASDLEQDLLEYRNTEDEGEDVSDVDEFYDNNRVEDEDWEIAERDFTKQYNRLRQYVAVRTGNARGTSSAINRLMSVAPLPAVNVPKSSTHNGTQLPLPCIHPKNRTTDQLTGLLKTYSSRLAKIDVPYVMGVAVNRKGSSAVANMKDKSDRATNEQVLDPRTRLILFKMIGRGLIHEVNGCVSTGKEANVYHALTPQNQHLALKVYKTSILIFKDRDKYVTGEHRFRHGYSRRNPRKMVRLWAEKELRNLKRLAAASIRCPEPIEVRENVLVMTFLGNAEGWASPRLKDAELPGDLENLSSLYIELVCLVRRMYHECKLVHSDLSEYNILVHDEHLYIIDVSQSVEHDHPSAYDFLRKDIQNVEDFFSRRGVKCLGIRGCFEFVTREDLGPANSSSSAKEELLEAWIKEAASRQMRIEQESESNTDEIAERSKENSHEAAERYAAHEDAVFLRSFIPRTLGEVYDPERDIERLANGQGNGLIYAKTIGIVGPSTGAQLSPPLEEQDDSGAIEVEENLKKIKFTEERVGGNPREKHLIEEVQESDSSEEEQGTKNDEVDPEMFSERKPRGHRHEDREAKKERKQAVKTEMRERRKQKIPKAEKKKLIKKTK